MLSGITGLLRWNTTGTTIAGDLNMNSANSDYLNYPIGMTFDSFNVLYVADSENNRVQQFSPGNLTGKTVAGQSNGTVGSGADRLNTPNDVAVDSNGNLFVVDTLNHRVQLWRVNATSGITIAGNGQYTVDDERVISYFIYGSFRFCGKFKYATEFSS